MNGAEAFFGIGDIIGPLIVAWMLREGVDWITVMSCWCMCTAINSTRLERDYPVHKAQPLSKTH